MTYMPSIYITTRQRWILFIRVMLCIQFVYEYILRSPLHTFLQSSKGKQNNGSSALTKAYTCKITTQIDPTSTLYVIHQLYGIGYSLSRRNM